MSIELLKARFKTFAIETGLLIQQLPEDKLNKPYCNQLVRSSSSAGANYRAACRAKSLADFINKLKIVEEELDESIYFLELLSAFNKSFDVQFSKLIKEGNELLAITVASIRTSREKQKFTRHSSLVIQLILITIHFPLNLALFIFPMWENLL